MDSSQQLTSQVGHHLSDTFIEPTSHSKTVDEVQTWMVSYLANLLEIDPDEIDPTDPFDRYGLDSAAAVGMTGDLEEWLGAEVDPTALYDYPTIQSLAGYLAA